MLHERFLEREFVVFLRGRILLGIGGVYSVHAGAFQQGSGSYFKGSQRGSRIGGEVGVARASGNQCDSSFFQDGHGVVPGVQLCERSHLRGGEHLCLDAFGAQSAAQGEGIDDCREHSHAVAGHPVVAFSYALDAAEDVAAAVYDGYLISGFDRLCNLAGEFAQALLIQALACRTSKAFAAEFE